MPNVENSTAISIDSATESRIPWKTTLKDKKISQRPNLFDSYLCRLAGEWLVWPCLCRSPPCSSGSGGPQCCGGSSCRRLRSSSPTACTTPCWIDSDGRAGCSYMLQGWRGKVDVVGCVIASVYNIFTVFILPESKCKLRVRIAVKHISCIWQESGETFSSKAVVSGL